MFAELDDFDIYSSIKVWSNSSDTILAALCKKLINRQLFHIDLEKTPIDELKMEKIKKEVIKTLNISPSDIDYFVFSDKVENNAYDTSNININILFKDGKILDLAEASDQLNISVLSQTVTKYFLCYPKEI